MTNTVGKQELDRLPSPSADEPSAHLLERAWTRLVSMRNQLAFGVRSGLQWKGLPYREPAESKENLFQHRSNGVNLAQREAVLIQAYDLADFKAGSTRSRYLETLTFLEHLEYSLGKLSESRISQDSCRWLDVGAKNWSYVIALHRYLQRVAAGESRLHGIELDGYRVYTDLRSRANYARTYIDGLSGVTYEVGDVLAHTESYDVVSLFLPFVFMEPCLAWGLPARHFQPQAFLAHVMDLVRPGGWLLIVNQGEDEMAEQERLLVQEMRRSPFGFEALGAMPESFLPYQYPRYGFRIHKARY